MNFSNSMSLFSMIYSLSVYVDNNDNLIFMNDYNVFYGNG